MHVSVLQNIPNHLQLSNFVCSQVLEEKLPLLVTLHKDTQSLHNLPYLAVSLGLDKLLCPSFKLLRERSIGQSLLIELVE